MSSSACAESMSLCITACDAPLVFCVCGPRMHLDTMLSSEYHGGYTCETLGKKGEKNCALFLITP